VANIETETTASVFLTQQPIRMLIGGKWVEAASGKTFDTINPSTGQVLAKVAEADAEDVDRAVAAAHRAFESGPWPKLEGETIAVSIPNMFTYTLREPVGVVGQIIPWNFPLQMAAWKLRVRPWLLTPVWIRLPLPVQLR
jgi:acyl-CoA reductase-like NAD-dependent aldehyde dehydrogenase